MASFKRRSWSAVASACCLCESAAFSSTVLACLEAFEMVSANFAERFSELELKTSCMVFCCSTACSARILFFSSTLATTLSKCLPALELRSVIVTDRFLKASSAAVARDVRKDWRLSSCFWRMRSTASARFSFLSLAFSATSLIGVGTDSSPSFPSTDFVVDVLRETFRVLFVAETWRACNRARVDVMIVAPDALLISISKATSWLVSAKVDISRAAAMIRI
mmetsp:Transcript_38112/g.80728  ORF Transcript_38112/g.80728 Transcript_38112/m.80728 type:complete len:222 (+) Transcript_38112:256-921(+)